MEKSTKVRAKNPAVFGRKAATSVLAVAMSLLLLPAPALAGDGGLGVAASTAQTLADSPQLPNEAVPASSDTTQTDSRPAASTDIDSSKTTMDATPSTDQPNATAAAQPVDTAPAPSDQSSLSVQDVSSHNPATETFTANILVNGQVQKCTFGVTGDTTVQIGNGIDPAIDTNSAGTIMYSPDVTGSDPVTGRTGTWTITGIGAHAFQNCTHIISTGIGTSGVASIGDNAFFGCTSLQSTGLSGNDSLTDISGNFVFYGCTALTDTNLAGNNTLTSISGKGTFQGCTALTDAELSESTALKSISGAVTFQGCTALTNTGLAGDNALTTISGDSTFADCTALKTTGLTSNAGLASITGNSTFKGCTALTDTGLAGNGTLTNISGSSTFQGCTKLADTGLGSNTGLQSIGDSTFQDCTSLKTTNLNANTVLKKLPTSAFQGCTSLTDTGLASNKTVTEIGDTCFKNCTALVHAAGGIAFFGNSQFDGDSSLTDVSCYGGQPCLFATWAGNTPPLTVYCLSEKGSQWGGIHPFLRAGDSLRCLSNVNVVGGTIASAPQKCYWADQAGTDATNRYLKGDKIALSVTNPANFFQWVSDDSTGSFDNIKSSTPVYTVGEPFGKAAATVSALPRTFEAPVQVGGKDYNCDFMTTSDSTVSIHPSGNHEIGGLATAIDSDAAGDLAIPNSVSYQGRSYAVTCIDDQSFISCDKLTSTGLVANKSITTVGASAFASCSSLTGTGLDSNTSITSIGAYAFWDCGKLTSTGLGTNQHVTSIGTSAFDSTALTDTGLASNTTLTSLGACVFQGCNALTDTGLSSNKTLTSLGRNAFHNCGVLTDTGLGANTTLTSLADGAFAGCGKLTTTGLDANKTLTTVGNNAFQGCSSLTDTGLATNGSVANIGNGVFSNCSALKHAAIGEVVRSMGTGCFSGDTSLSDLCFYCNWAPSNNTWLGTLPAAPITLYYVAPNYWEDATATEVARTGDSLKELSQLKVVGGSASTNPASYWGTLENTPAYGYYAQDEKVSITASGGMAFLKWSSDDSTGKFDNDSASSAAYTIGAPTSGITTVTALSQSFTGTITIGGKPYDCTYVVGSDKIAQIGNGTEPAVGTAASGDMVLPTEVKYDNVNYQVKRIAASAFKGCTAITSTDLNDANSSIEFIGDNAFQGCTDLQETGLGTFSHVVSLGSGAFEGCTNLTRTGFNANSSVAQIGSGAFEGCTSLPYPDFTPNNSFNFIGSDVFKDCTNLTDTMLENVSVTGIGSGAFQGCTKLTDTGMALDKKVTSIGDSAFADTGIQNAAIGFAVTSFGDACFDGDNLSSVCFYGNVPPQDTAWLGARKNGSSIAFYYLAERSGWSGKTAASLTSVAGDSLKALSHLDKDGGLISTPPLSSWPAVAGSDTQDRYVQGAKVDIVASTPNSFLRWISDDNTGSFADETASSTTYTVGAPTAGTAKLTALAPRFSGTLQISGANTPCTYVAANDGTAQIGDGTSAAIDAAKTGDVSLPSTVDYGGKTYVVKSLAANAFKNCAHITSTGLASNSSVTTMGNAAFSGCVALVATGLESNTSITSMGQGAFQGCTSLANTGLSANNTLKTIAQNAFQGCTTLASTGLTANTSIILVDGSAFAGCTGLTDTGLGVNTAVTTVGANAFQGCTALASTGLATNTHMTSLGLGAFQGCTALSDTGLASNLVLATLGDNVFAGCKALKATGLGANSHITTIGQGTFSDCAALVDTGLAANKIVKAIGADAFLNCAALTDTGLESNSTATSLDAGVFKGCSALVHAGIGSGITSMGQGCFDGDTALKDVCFYGSALTAGGSTWLGTPSATPIAVYYMAENPTWHNKTLAEVARTGDSLRALSHLTVVGGTALASSSCYWASVPGVASGRYAQGDEVPITSSDPSTFLAWSSDDSSALFSDAAAATTVYTVGAPASGIAILTVATFVPANPDNPWTPDNGSDATDDSGSDGSSSADSGFDGDGDSVSAADAANAAGAGSDATSSQQSNGSWYSGSDSSHDGSSDSSADESSSSKSGGTGNFFSVPATTGAGLALGTVLAAVLAGLLLIRRHK